MSKSKFLFFLLCLVSSVFVFTSVSCKPQATPDKPGEDTSTKKMNVKQIKIWKKDVLSKPNTAKESVQVLPVADSQTFLEIMVDNCSTYEFTATVQGETYAESTTNGFGTVKIPELPTEAATLAISITASGYESVNIFTNVNVKVQDIENFDVTFVEKEGGTEGNTIEIQKDNQNVYVVKTEGILKISSPDVDMQEVKIDGSLVTPLTNKREVTKDYTGISGEKSVTVAVTYKYHKPISRAFKLKKTTEDERPLELVSAKILSGDNNKEETVLEFKEGDKESVTMTLDKNIRYSLVTLEMEFNQKVTSRTVKCTDQRPDNYNTEFFTPQGISGTFSGYLIADIDDKGVEKQITTCQDKKYTELLIVGYGTVSYEIEVKAENGKTLTRTVEIINPAETVSSDGKSLNKEHFQDVFPIEGHSGREFLYWLDRKQLNNVFAPPFYFKGPIFNEGQLNPSGFDDLAYMENVNLYFVGLADKPIYFYYNVFSDNATGQPEDKHEFKRIKGKLHQGKTQKYSSLSAKIKDDLDGKYLDCFISGEKSLPNPMTPLLYGKKITKAKNIKHGWLLQVENNMPVKLTNDSKPSSIEVFLSIFNYRLQMKAYEEQNAFNNSEPQYLTIAKKQKYSFLPTGKEESGWTPFLSGAKGDNRDVFVFRPLFDASLIKEVKYTLKKGSDKVSCSEVDGYKDQEAKLFKTEKGMPFIIIAAKAGNDGKPDFFDFEHITTANNEINVYLIELTVIYKDTTTDKFNFMIDYKNQITLESKDVGYYGGDADLFGVPTHYGVMKEMSPARMHSVADYSLADCTLVE